MNAKMNALGLSPGGRIADFGPLLARVIVGVIMAAHGLQKLVMGPGAFGSSMLGAMGVPFPTFMGYVVVFVELVGGILLILGLLSRLAALLLTINLLVAILLVKVQIGLISPTDPPAVGAELDLALIAGFLVILLMGPGKLALDRMLGIEAEPAARNAGTTARAR